MKKRGLSVIGLFLMAALFMLMRPVTNVCAEESKTVIFVKDGGMGDGSSPEQAAGTLITAYSTLDTSKDVTIVICGPFTQIQHFDYPLPYEGSVTITSVYDGVDYREQGAVFQFESSRFICYGDTRFENINFVGLGDYLLVVGQHYPVTIGEGVDISGENLTGSSIAKSFSILGGYQKGVGEPPEMDDTDTNITVLSGSKIYIVAFSRQVAGAYTGTAHITIGGNADVSVLHMSAAYPDGIILGDTEALITDDAHVGAIYGCTQDTEMNSVKLTWESGTIDLLEWCCSSTPGKILNTAGGKILFASDEVKTQENYEALAAEFDTVAGIGEELPVEEPESTQPEATEPESTQPETTEPESTQPETTEPEPTQPITAPTEPESGFPIGAVLAVVCVLAVIVAAALVIKGKKNKRE